MIVYCDTSVMVSALSAEAYSAAVREGLDTHRDRVAISDWVITEFSGALSMKRRMGIVGAAGWSNVMASWRRVHQAIPVERLYQHHFQQAAVPMDRDDVKVRSADALHLAVVAERGFALATLDRDFATAAALAEVTVVPVLA